MNTDRTQSRQHGRDVRDGIMFTRYAAPRRRMEEIWALCAGKPLKFPSRRRREDRLVPLPQRAA